MSRIDITMVGVRHTRWMRTAVVTGALGACALLGVIAVNSMRWVGTTFPGFFVMVNRVVPSIALDSWGPTTPLIFQHQVVAVDGVAVQSAAAVYEEVARRAPGTPIRYSLRAPDGTSTAEVIRCRRFSLTDYILIFGAYLLTGSSFIGAAFLVLWWRPRATASVGLLSACVGLGAFALTAADLYGPHWFVRLHVLAEAMFPAGFIHLALVFPRDHLPRWRRPLLLAVYLSLLLLALGYEVVLYWPSAYTTVHLVASAAHGICGIAILAAVIYDRFATDSALVRWRIGVVGAGAVTAFIAPTLLMGGSGLFGGSVPVNGAALTAFIFPLSMAYAILRRDLFQTGIFATHTDAAAAGWAARVTTWLRQGLERLDMLLGGWLLQAGLGVAAVLSVALIGTTGWHSTARVGSSFPGFFVMQNRVIPSVALADWVSDTNVLFQHEILAVDGVPADSGAAVYEGVRSRPAGTPIAYSLRAPDGTNGVEVVRSRRFSETDYMSVFGAFLLTGSAFLLAGLVVFGLRPRSAASQGFLSAGVVGGVFVLTAIDLYGPYWFFRLHVVAEALVPASLLHLALVFPTNRMHRGRPVLLATYGVCLLLAVLYELALYRPAAYSAVHLAASIAQAIGGLTLIWVITYDLLTTRSELVRRRILVAAVGTVAAFLLPTVLMGASGLLDGQVPVNAAAVTGFLFPLSFAYAIAKRNLLKVDVFLVRAAMLFVVIGLTVYAAAAHALAELATGLR